MPQGDIGAEQDSTHQHLVGEGDRLVELRVPDSLNEQDVGLDLSRDTLVSEVDLVGRPVVIRELNFEGEELGLRSLYIVGELR